VVQDDLHVTHAAMDLAALRVDQVAQVQAQPSARVGGNDGRHRIAAPLAQLGCRFEAREPSLQVGQPAGGIDARSPEALGV
jgi:hypothetical protein